MTSASSSIPLVNLDGVRTTVKTLEELLHILYPDAPNLDILTVEDIKRRYRLTGLGVPAMQAIERSQRILRAIGNYRQIGLCEFHIGLIYLHWGDCQGAGQQFAEARRQWSFDGDMAFVCLAYFAEGRARHYSFHQELAMANYGKAALWLPRINFSPSESRGKFIEKMEKALREAQEALRREMWPYPDGFSEEAPPPSQPETSPADPEQTPAQSTIALEPALSQTVPRPIIRMTLFSPIPAHEKTSEQYHWYQVVERHGDFLANIPQGAWLLAAERTAEQQYEPGELIIISGKDSLEGSISVRPGNQSTPFSRIYLACVPPFTGPFSRNMETGEVTLLTGQGSRAILPDNILGVVVGCWLAKQPS